MTPGANSLPFWSDERNLGNKSCSAVASAVFIIVNDPMYEVYMYIIS